MTDQTEQTIEQLTATLSLAQQERDEARKGWEEMSAFVVQDTTIQRELRARAEAAEQAHAALVAAVKLLRCDRCEVLLSNHPEYGCSVCRPVRAALTRSQR